MEIATEAFKRFGGVRRNGWEKMAVGEGRTAERDLGFGGFGKNLWCTIGFQTGDGHRKANVWRRLRNEDRIAVLAVENFDGVVTPRSVDDGASRPATLRGGKRTGNF